MNVYVSYSRFIGVQLNQLDLDKVFYEGHALPTTGPLFRVVGSLDTLGYLMEHNKALYVLDKNMEDLKGGMVTYDVIEPYIQFIINASSIIVVEPAKKVLERFLDENKIGVPGWTQKEEEENKKEESDLVSYKL